MSRPRVVGIGELLWDLLPDGKALGGAPANFVYVSHVLGADTRVVTCVGRDADGDEAFAASPAGGTVDRILPAQ
jgi:fructokinase